MGGDVQIGEAEAEARIGIVVPTRGQIEECSVSAADGDDVEAPVPALLVQRLGNVQAQLTHEGLVAEPVHHGSDVILAGTA